MQNVNAGIRAFFVGGGKARFDGMDAVTGEKKFRSISKTEDSAYAAWESPVSAASMRGTSLEFRLTPVRVSATCGTNSFFLLVIYSLSSSITQKSS